MASRFDIVMRHVRDEIRRLCSGEHEFEIHRHACRATFAFLVPNTSRAMNLAPMILTGGKVGSHFEARCENMGRPVVGRSPLRWHQYGQRLARRYRQASPLDGCTSAGIRRESNSLAQLPVPRLQRFCGHRVGDDRISLRSNLFHFSSSTLHAGKGCFEAEFGSGHHRAATRSPNPLRNVGPAIRGRDRRRHIHLFAAE